MLGLGLAIDYWEILLAGMVAVGLVWGYLFIRAIAYEKLSEELGRKSFVLFLLPILRFIPLSRMVARDKKGLRALCLSFLLGAEILVLTVLFCDISLMSLVPEALLSGDSGETVKEILDFMGSFFFLLTLAFRNTVVSLAHMGLYLRRFKTHTAIIWALIEVWLPVAPFVLIAAVQRRPGRELPAEREGVE